MPTILDKIVTTKRGEIERARTVLPERELRARLAESSPVRDFFTPLAAGGPIKLIAEVKKASPSAGVIRADFDPVSIAQTYEAHGATCISVLTDESYFQGRMENLSQIRAAIGLPVLRKDFILDTYQVVKARVAGADAVLLIAECLDDCNLRKLFNETCEMGMTPLVELYQPENLQRVFDAGATLIGVNNRDLNTFSVDLEHTIRMRERVPDECVLVGESGIKTHEDVQRLEAAGVDAILVGESLMREPDIGAAVDRLLGQINLREHAMSEYVQVTTTTGTRHDAEQIASELVSRRLAGCTQVTGPITSTFRWQGKVETAEEWMCTVKTTRAQLDAIQKLFGEIHPYEVPEVIATPIVDGSAAYLKWLGEQVGSGERGAGSRERGVG